MDKLVNDSTSIKIPSYGEESEIKVNDYMVLDVFSSVDQTSGICEEQICFINDYIQKDDFKCLEDSMALALIHFSNHDSIILEQFAESKSQRLSLLSKELLFSLKVLNADYPDTYLDFEPILDSLLQESLKYIDKGYRTRIPEFSIALVWSKKYPDEFEKTHVSKYFFEHKIRGVRIAEFRFYLKYSPLKEEKVSKVNYFVFMNGEYQKFKNLNYKPICSPE